MNLRYIYLVLFHYIQVCVITSQTSLVCPSLDGPKIPYHAQHPTHFPLPKGEEN